MAAIFHRGDDQIISGYSEGWEQRNTTITLLKDGGWLITWDASHFGSQITSIHQQRYDAGGNTIGSKATLYTSTTEPAEGINVVALADGGWLATWQKWDDGRDVNVYQQRYNADGSVHAPPERVNRTADKDQFLSHVTALKDGGWLVTWVGSEASGYNRDIYQQRYDATGTAIGTRDERVNTSTGETETNPNTIALADGGWIVTWDDHRNVKQQRYNADGSRNGTEVLVSTIGGQNDTKPSVTALKDGGWLVIWMSGESGGPADLYQRRYDRDGLPEGEAERVNASKAAAHTAEALTVKAMSDGGWLVVWQADSWGPLYQQRYDRDGQAMFTDAENNPVDQLVSTTYISGSAAPSVMELPDGSWIITWANSGSGAIRHRQFEFNVAPDTLDLDGLQVAEDAAYGTTIGTLSATDNNDGDVFTYTLLDDPEGRFEIKDGKLVVKSPSKLDHETATSHQIRIQVSDKAGASYTKTFIIQVNDSPDEVSLSGNTVLENAAKGTVVGTLRVADRPDGVTYEVLGDAADSFEVSNGQLVVKNGSDLDYEKDALREVRIKVTDRAGASHEAVLTVHLIDGLDILRGGKGKDVLIGTAGEDRIYGGLGNDTLTGKAGKDVFVFNTKPNKKTNLDKITDFDVKDDTIWLDNAVFKKLGKGTETKPGKLNKKFFTIGDKAKDENDYLIYDKKKGILYYDQDGSGEKAAVEIAKLPKNLKLTASDFLIV
ncbi:cadherin domain-containing protein [Microvirga flavescens]|uniref:cadherin domain-containing protein n=1 Tax=Microvirga flavescens TaxID=2249811 RepID=UPI000DD87FC4|nr:cadherin domain-containing protein [Microvirga flavescens]